MLTESLVFLTDPDHDWFLAEAKQGPARSVPVGRPPGKTKVAGGSHVSDTRRGHSPVVCVRPKSLTVL